MRAMLAPRVFRKCGKNVRIFHEVEFSFGYNLTVGDGVTIHRNVLIDDRGEVVIGNDASISDYANIYSHAHAVEDIHNISLGKTEIGDRARITYHAVVLSGVKVANDAIVGSMGVASKPVEAGWIVGGIPAKLIAQKTIKG
jgi:acetyltransferase-like isoleucine patch superfamily enzyme